MADDVIQLPGTEARNPKTHPERGDIFSDGRYTRTFHAYHREGDAQTPPRETATHVHYGTPRSVSLMPIDRWMAWAASADIKPHGRVRRLHSQYGCISRVRDREIERLTFAWGTVTRHSQDRDRFWRSLVVFEVFGVVRQVRLPAGVNLETLGWAFHSGMVVALQLGDDERAAAERTAEQMLGNVVDMR